MGGGLINIVSYGLNDLYLTGAPQITLFKTAYRRHTNFSVESVSVPIGHMNFGDEIEVFFPRIGDLFGSTYVQIELPEIHLLKSDVITDGTILTPLELPFTQQELEIINYYDKIIEFTAINSVGYRYATTYANVKNQTVQTYVENILQTINNLIKNSDIETQYANALQTAYAYEHEKSNVYDFILCSTGETSNIKTILNNRIVTPNLYDNYTKELVAKIVSDAIETNVRVKNYFFKKVKCYNELRLNYESNYAKFAWVDKIGHAIIDRIDVNIGGERIDRHYGEWINIWMDLTTKKTNVYEKMIGNVKELVTYDKNSKPKYTLTIPLMFWFCKNYGLALPVIALERNNVSLVLKLKKIEKCAYVENIQDTYPDTPLTQLSLSDTWDNMGYELNVNLLVDYVFLDSLERQRFAQSAHEYLIECVQRTSIDNTSDPVQTIPLDFNGPCKELIWFAQKSEYISDNSFYKKLHFIYSVNSNGTVNPIIKSKLLLNNYVRFESYNDKYYNYLQPHNYHTSTPLDGINTYSFALFPEEHQPSGSCNFSKIPNSVLLLTLDDNMFTYDINDIIGTVVDDGEILTTSVNIVIYTKRYNVLRFIGGMGGFAYKYL